MANMIGEAESLKTALACDPSQADVHTRLGFYYLYDPFLFDLPRAVHHFEAAVQLQPYDCNAWSNLGRAYEQQSDAARAERAYVIGSELAPHYFYPHWAYGNYFLRQGKIERAFGEFHRVAEIHPEAIGNICELIWQATEGNAEALARFGTSLRSGAIQGAICRCLMVRAAYPQAVDVWNTLVADDPAKSDLGRSLVSSLSKAGQGSLAQGVWRAMVSKQSGKPADLAFWNGDFEYDAEMGRFDWRMNSSPAVQVWLDTSERYRGNRSLLLDFKQYQEVHFGGVTHDLWVEPSTRYRLWFYYKTEKMPQINGLTVVLSEAEAPAQFNAQSEPLGNESQWTRKEILFETPPETRILRLRIVREPVGKLYDYIQGRVWFDSFGLESLLTEGDENEMSSRQRIKN
jgi:tetratricopeptide (TPR) repeat protein